MRVKCESNASQMRVKCEMRNARCVMRNVRSEFVVRDNARWNMLNWFSFLFFSGLDLRTAPLPGWQHEAFMNHQTLQWCFFLERSSKFHDSVFNNQSINKVRELVSVRHILFQRKLPSPQSVPASLAESLMNVRTIRRHEELISWGGRNLLLPSNFCLISSFLPGAVILTSR